MRYVPIEWEHDHPDEPVTDTLEVNEAGWETRRIDDGRDGSTTRR